MVHLTQENLLMKWADECFVPLESSTKREANVKYCMLLTSELFSHYYQQKQWELSRQKIIYPFPRLGDDLDSNWPWIFWSSFWEKRWASLRYSIHPMASGYFPCSRVHQKECVFELHSEKHPTFTGIKEVLWILHLHYENRDLQQKREKSSKGWKTRFRTFLEFNCIKCHCCGCSYDRLKSLCNIPFTSLAALLIAH